MICTKCGARIMENDQFCPKCGARAIKDKRCPDCGALLRDGVKFCPECGRAVGGRRKASAVSDETLDIPIEAIERNILSETAAEIKSDRAPRRSASGTKAPVKRTSSDASAGRKPSSGGGSSRTAPAKRAPVREEDDSRRAAGSAAGRKKQSAVPAPPPRKKKPVYREEVWEDDDWDEDEDWEDDDDWDDDEEGIDVITIMTVVIGCVLLIVVAFLGFHMYRQYVPKDYDRAAEEQEEGQEDPGGESESQEGEGSQETPVEEGDADVGQEQTGSGSRLTINSKVNVRDQPSTNGTNVLKVAQAGETYVCNGVTEDNEWYEIVLEDGTVAYVNYKYVTVE